MFRTWNSVGEKPYVPRDPCPHSSAGSEGDGVDEDSGSAVSRQPRMASKPNGLFWLRREAAGYVCGMTGGQRVKEEVRGVRRSTPQGVWRNWFIVARCGKLL